MSWVFSTVEVVFMLRNEGTYRDRYVLESRSSRDKDVTNTEVAKLRRCSSHDRAYIF